jgi:multicomponent Na+:H+ antiporter subunit D
MSLLPILPVLIPVTTGALMLLGWRRRTFQRWLSLIGSAALLLASLFLFAAVNRHGHVTLQLGNWPAPFGITFVADLLSATMVVLAALTGLAVGAYSLVTIDVRRESFGFHPLMHILLMGVCGAFLTGDLFNLFVWFEVMLIASFVLLALGGERPQLEGAMKYVAINLVSSAVFLSAVGLLYGMVGTLNMADLALKVREVEEPAGITAIAMLLMVTFGIKAAMFPLFFWLPASYHTPPIPITAFFAGLLTKVGVYALIRVFTLIFVQETHFTHTFILVLSGLTMATGVLGAVAQNEFRRVLSFHIISQIGYMTLGLGFFTPLGLAGSIFYIMHHIIVKTNLFLVSGMAARLNGTYELKHMGGLAKAQPFLAILFFIPAMSLAGIPPLSGFFGKYALVRAGLAIDQYALVAVALAVGLCTMFSMTKIWNEAFWKDAPEGSEPAPALTLRVKLLGFGPIVAFATITLLIGVFAGPLWEIAERAAHQLMNPTEYIRAVLPERI